MKTEEYVYINSPNRKPIFAMSIHCVSHKTVI